MTETTRDRHGGDINRASVTQPRLSEFNERKFMFCAALGSSLKTIGSKNMTSVLLMQLPFGLIYDPLSVGCHVARSPASKSHCADWSTGQLRGF